MHKTSRRSLISNNITRDDVRRMRSYLWLSSVLFIFVIGILLFFFNLLWWVSQQADKAGHVLEDKLSMYFHILSDENDRENIENRVRELEAQLAQNDIQSRYITKEQARQYFSMRMPNLATTFDQYGIVNPLQASLYVLVDSDKDYAALVDILPQYIDIITNMNDIQASLSLEQQDSLVSKTLRSVSLMRRGSGIMMWLFGVIMLVVIWLMTRQLMYHFRDKIQIKSLLWANLAEITKPFVFFNVSLVVAWYAMMIVLFLVAYLVMQQYNVELVVFQQRSNIDLTLPSVATILGNAWYMLIVQLIVVAGLMAAATHLMVLKEKHRKHR